MNTNLDPNLMAQIASASGMQMPNQNQTSQLPQRMRGAPIAGGLDANGLVSGGMGYQVQPNLWQNSGFDAMPVDGQSPSDSWSNTSANGPAVPATLNVEDW
jgi:hypothetical protein